MIIFSSPPRFPRHFVPGRPVVVASSNPKGPQQVKCFRRMDVVVPTLLGWNEMHVEAADRATAEMAPHGLRPGAPKFVEFQHFHGLQYAHFKVRAYPKLRRSAS